MKSYLILAHLLLCFPITPMDPSLPKPFQMASSMPNSSSEVYISPYEVSKRTHMTADIYKKNGKLYLQVNLYFKNIKIMQNNYRINPKEIAKL